MPSSPQVEISVRFSLDLARSVIVPAIDGILPVEESGHQEESVIASKQSYLMLAHRLNRSRIEIASLVEAEIWQFVSDERDKGRISVLRISRRQQWP